jgi:hypothetical protein
MEPHGSPLKVKVAAVNQMILEFVREHAERKGVNLATDGACEVVAREYAEIEAAQARSNPESGDESQVRLVVGSTPRYPEHVWVRDANGRFLDPKAALDQVDVTGDEYDCRALFTLGEATPSILAMVFPPKPSFIAK